MTAHLTRRGVLLGGGAAAIAAAAAIPVSQDAAAQAAASQPHVGGQPAPAAPIRWGVNYTPSGPWWLVWSRWDAGRVARDLHAIRSLGVDHIRIQLPWSLFQPRIDEVDATRLRHVVSMLDIAHAAGLEVCITVISAWLSGRSFRPHWVGNRNWLTDGRINASQHMLFDQVGRAVAGHEGVLGIDLGNELLSGRVPGTSQPQFATWAGGHLRTARKRIPGGMHCVSTFGWPTPRRGALAAHLGDTTVVHAWDFRPYIGWNGFILPDSVHTAEYLLEGYRAYHNDLNRTLWLQETGAPLKEAHGLPVVSPDLAPDFAEQLLRNALSCQQLYGITWWCSHDIDSRFLPSWLPEYEYSLGLFDRNGKRKPVADRFAEVIAEQRAGGFPAPGQRSVAVIGDDRLTFDRLTADGVKATFVLPALAQNAGHLAARGIREVVPPGT